MDTANNSTNRFNLAPGLKSEAFRADEIGFHRITLARARKAGRLGFIRVGDRPMYLPDHVAAWLESMERPAQSGKAA